MERVFAQTPRSPTRVTPWGQLKAAVDARPQRLALGAILALSAFLELFRLDRVGYGNTYYAATVRSMLTSWHNFFFASYDPGGFVSVDKPPVGFWLQAVSARLFGFSGVSLLLPEALASVLSVGVLYLLVRRAWGVGAGLVAALALAVTPIAVVTGRNNTIDSLLVLTLLGAAWAMLRANRTGRLRWLLASMALVGLGFNVKMLEAFLPLPALAALYLVGTRTRGWRLIGHGALAALVLVTVSLSWVTAVDLTPASARPYVGSSSSNSALELALGYNGLQRLLGRSRSSSVGAGRPASQPVAGGFPGGSGSNGNGPTAPGNAEFANRSQPTNGEVGDGRPADAGVADRTQRPGAPPGGGGGGGIGGINENGPKGILRLLDSELGPQVSWILPLALLGLVAAAWQTRIRRQLPLNRAQQAIVLWGVWFATGATFFSVASFFHRYYMVTLAPGIAALAGIGVAALWRDFGRRRWRGGLLPLTLLVTAATQLYLLRDDDVWLRRLAPVISAGTLVAVLALGALRLWPRWNQPRAGALTVTLALLTLLAAPTIWGGFALRGLAVSTLPSAGPTQAGAGFGVGRGAAGAGFPASNILLSLSALGNRGEQVNQRLIGYLEAERGSARFLVAVDSSMAASPIILATGEPVMTLGGFSGNDPILTTDALAELVKNGTVRYFLGNVTSWVQQNCPAVPASDDGSNVGGSTLYDCSVMATGS